MLAANYEKTADEYHWTFSAMYTPYNLMHPVSGNRRFGLKRDGSDWVFYIMAADRATDLGAAGLVLMAVIK